MSISTITTDDLRHMNGKEGLVLQGCGGDPQEWLDGINGLLTDEGIFIPPKSHKVYYIGSRVFFQEPFSTKGQLRLYADRCHLS